MECYKCGAVLGPEDACPHCGADVKMYKKLVATSNHLYNIGLERAKVRDLSGAIDALKGSLQYNKVNIQARNLLGLIYFEMGETVSALSEWVISKNCQAEGNPADRYLTDVQTNPALLNATNQAIKKFNQALLYCQQDSKDLAIIQLKKLTSTNPKLVKAHQLLALLYIDGQKYEQARKVLNHAATIDRNNTITMRYLAEVDMQLGEKAGKKKKKKKENKIEYQHGNDTIIQPANMRDNSGRTMIINILVGFCIGVTVTYFLIVPSIRQQIQKSAGVEVTNANDTIADKNQKIQNLEAEIIKLEKETEDAKGQEEESLSRIDSYEKLLQAYEAYHQEDTQAAGDALAEVNQDQLSDDAKVLYEALKTDVDAKYLETTYAAAYSRYTALDYTAAAEGLQKVIDLDDAYHDGDALYYLAQSYRMIGHYEQAKTLYEQVIARYPNTYKSNNSQQYLSEVVRHLDTEE